MDTRNRQRSEMIPFYQENIQRQQDLIRQKKKIKAGLAAARLAVFLFAAGLVYYFWPSVGSACLSAGVCGIVLVVLIFTDAGKTGEIRNHERLIRINRHETDALQQQLNEYDDGRVFANPLHAYASDLDLFGPASLFQFISRCHADQSKKLLADQLLNPLPVQTIGEKQAAAKEVSDKVGWSQQFQSAAMANPLTFQTEKRMKQWMQEQPGIFEKGYWKGIVILYSLISLSLLTL
ncbi:MAG TPA: hypothetical protein VGM24_01185, partial [Puia sp.]